MIVLGLTAYVLALALGVCLAWGLSRNRIASPPRLGDVAVERALRAAASRARIAVLVAAAVALALAVVAPAAIALAPSAGAVAGLLVYAAAPPRAQEPGAPAVQTASLEPRRPWSFITRSDLLGTAMTFVLLMAVLVATGLTATTDETSGWDSYRYASEDAAALELRAGYPIEGASAAASPYPGWSFAVPLIVVSALLVAITALALHRVTGARSLPGPALGAADRHWRGASSRVITGLCRSTGLLTLGAVTAVAGLAITSVFSHDWSPEHGRTVGLLIAWAGAVALALSVIEATRTALHAFCLPSQARRLISSSRQPAPATGTRP